MIHRTRNRALAFCLLPIVVALAACGGSGGSGESGTGLTGKSVSGTVVDGAFESASLSCLNGGEPVATGWSGEAGEYRLDLPAGGTCSVVEARGGISVGVSPEDPAGHTDRPALVRRAPVPPGDAPADKVVLSPLTTLIQALIDRGVPLDDALVRVREALGLRPSASLLDTDPASDLDLARASHLVDQVVSHTASAIAVAGGIGDPETMQAITLIVFDTLAAELPRLGRGALAPEVSTLSADTPLVAFVRVAFGAAKGHPVVGPLLASADPETLAPVAGPGVADAGALLGSTDAADLAGRVRGLAENDRAAVLVGDYGLTLIPGGPLEQAAEGQTVEGKNVSASNTSLCPTTTWPSNTLALNNDNLAWIACDRLRLYATSFGTTPQETSIKKFVEGGVNLPGMVAINGGFVGYGLNLRQLGSTSQFSGSRTSAFALEIEDVDPARATSGAVRRIQVIIESVRLTMNSSRVVSATIPSGAYLYVYARTKTAVTRTPIRIQMRAPSNPSLPNPLRIVRTDSGEVRFDLDLLLKYLDQQVGTPTAYPSNPTSINAAIDFLNQNRVSSGVYKVTLVLANTRIGWANKELPSFGTSLSSYYNRSVRLAPAQKVIMRTNCTTSGCSSSYKTTSGYGWVGFVRVVTP